LTKHEDRWSHRCDASAQALGPWAGPAERGQACGVDPV